MHLALQLSIMVAFAAAVDVKTIIDALSINEMQMNVCDRHCGNCQKDVTFAFNQRARREYCTYAGTKTALNVRCNRDVESCVRVTSFKHAGCGNDAFNGTATVRCGTCMPQPADGSSVLINCVKGGVHLHTKCDAACLTCQGKVKAPVARCINTGWGSAGARIEAAPHACNTVTVSSLKGTCSAGRKTSSVTVEQNTCMVDGDLGFKYNCGGNRALPPMPLPTVPHSGSTAGTPKPPASSGGLFTTFVVVFFVCAALGGCLYFASQHIVPPPATAGQHVAVDDGEDDDDFGNNEVTEGVLEMETFRNRSADDADAEER
jgi:hypothetical protein